MRRGAPLLTLFEKWPLRIPRTAAPPSRVLCASVGFHVSVQPGLLHFAFGWRSGLPLRSTPYFQCRLYSMRKNSDSSRFSGRARLQSCRKSLKWVRALAPEVSFFSSNDFFRNLFSRRGNDAPSNRVFQKTVQTIKVGRHPRTFLFQHAPC